MQTLPQPILCARLHRKPELSDNLAIRLVQGFSQKNTTALMITLRLDQYHAAPETATRAPESTRSFASSAPELYEKYFVSTDLQP